MSFIKITLTVAALSLLAVSAQAHDYVKQGRSISQTNQWDVNLSAPFARDENTRFTD